MSSSGTNPQDQAPSQPSNQALSNQAPGGSSTSAALLAADLPSSFAVAGGETRIVLIGRNFDPGMKAGFSDNIADAQPIEIDDENHAGVYLNLPAIPADVQKARDVNDRVKITVTLFDHKGHIVAHRRLATHLLPKDQIDQANDPSLTNRLKLHAYVRREQKAATLRNKAASAQRQFDNSGKAVPFGGEQSIPRSIPSNSGPDDYCRVDSPAEQAYIRIRRSVMDPKEASDAFGRRLGRHFVVFQVTVENQNTDYQYMLHDVSIDVSQLYGLPLGTYRWAFSSQELSMLRGVPEKGSDYDPRNLTFHILRSVGTVAGGVSGLTADSLQDVFSGAVAGYNGPFLSSFIDIFPDHTATQLNRLSDSAFSTNTVVEKEGAKVFAIFVPASLLLTNGESRKFWRNPHELMRDTGHDFRLADVCVDGTFITQALGLNIASVSFEHPEQAQPNADVTIDVKGTSLIAGDTSLVIFGQNVGLTSINDSKTAGSVSLKLPPDYDPQRSYSAYLISSGSGHKSTTINLAAAPNPALDSITFADPKLAVPGASATLNITGKNLISGDTTFHGLGLDVPLVASTDHTTATVAVQLPTLPNPYDPTKAWPVELRSKSGYKTASGTLPAVLSLQKATLPAGAVGAADNTVSVDLTGTGLVLPGLTVLYDGTALAAHLQNISTDGTSAKIAIPLTSGTTYSGSHSLQLKLGAAQSATVTIAPQ